MNLLFIGGPAHGQRFALRDDCQFAYVMRPLPCTLIYGYDPGLPNYNEHRYCRKTIDLAGVYVTVMAHDSINSDDELREVIQRWQLDCD